MGTRETLGQALAKCNEAVAASSAAMSLIQQAIQELPSVGTPPVEPPPGGGIPPPSGNYVTGEFIGKGNPDRSDGQSLTLNSGQVKCYPLPIDGSPTGSINMGEVAGSPQPRDMFVCFSRTPGRIEGAEFLRASDKQIGAIFMTHRVVTGPPERGGSVIDGSNASQFGYAWCPPEQGPWFVNVRYDYDMSRGPKPMLLVWAPGPY